MAKTSKEGDTLDPKKETRRKSADDGRIGRDEISNNNGSEAPRGLEKSDEGRHPIEDSDDIKKTIKTKKQEATTKKERNL